MNTADILRAEMLTHLSTIKTVKSSWPSWKAQLDHVLSANPTGLEILELGSKLSDIFQANVVSGRGQSAVSSAGTGWESLICWYLNLVLQGTNTVAVKSHKKFLPKAISQATAVTIANHSANTESDIVVFTVPELGSAPYSINAVSEKIMSEADKCNVTIVQCKTNWNDNAQIPMLWDLIYSTRANAFKVPGVSIGTGGIAPDNLGRLNYAFMTVPTSRGSFKSNSTSVLRVRNLSGGNYWGKATEPGVARSISEFFSANFAAAFKGSVQQHIDSRISSDPDYLTSYLGLDFV